MSWVVSAVITVVAASIVYSQAQAKKMAEKAKRDRDKNGGTLITAKEPAAQRRIIYGRRRLGGTYAFQHSTDTPGGKTNEWLHLIIMLAGHEVEGIDDIYFDDVVVPLDGAGNCVTGKYSGLVRVKKYLGTASQTADADLIAEAPDKWTANHRMRGVAYVYVRLKYDQEKLATIPNISAVVRGKKLYDPRTGLTAYSANPALALRDYLTNTDYGLGCASDEINEGSFIVGASLCDESVAIAAGGTEPRYSIGGSFERDQAPEKIISELAASMSASCVCTGGLWYLTGGSYSAPSAAYTLDDLRGQIVIQSKASRRDTCNAVKGTYTSELNKWQPADYPPIKNATYATQDTETIWRELDFPWTTSAATAQRLAKIELEQTRQEITVDLPLKLTGMRVQAGDTVTLTIPRYGWTAKVFQVTSWKLLIEDGAGEGGGRIVGVDLSLRETAAGVWDWNSGMETTVDLAPNTTLPDPSVVPAPTGLSVTSSAQINADGSVAGRLDVTWVPSTDAFAQTTTGILQVQYKLAAAPDWITHASLTGQADRTTIAGLTSGAAYLVRIRAVRPGGAASAWVVTGSSITAAGDTTAPGVPTGLAASAMVQGIRLSWVNPTAADLANIEVLEQASALPTPSAGTSPSFRLLSDTFTRVGLAIGTTRYYWVRAVDASGNASAWAGPVSATATAVDATELTGQIQVAQLAVGLGGGNLLSNSAPTLGAETVDWELSGNSTGLTLTEGAGFDVWRPPAGGSVFIEVNGTPASNTFADIVNKPNGQLIPVKPGQRYELSAYLSAHRCTGQVRVAWWNSAGGYISEDGGSGVTSAGSGALSGWGRSTGFAVAPAGAALALFYVRAQTFTGTDPFVFIANAYFGEALPNQTAFSFWSASGISTLIDGKTVRAETVGADQLAARAVLADKIGVGEVNALHVGTNIIVSTAANIGDAVISTAKIGDAQITTLKVVGNAITHPFVSNQSGIAYLNNTSFVTLASVAGVAAGGSSVVVTTSVSLTNNSSASRDFILETLRDGTVLDSVTHRLPANYDTVMTRMMLDSGASGTHTYSAQVRVTTAPGTSNTVWAEKGVIQPSIYKR